MWPELLSQIVGMVPPSMTYSLPVIDAARSTHIGALRVRLPATGSRSWNVPLSNHRARPSGRRILLERTRFPDRAETPCRGFGTLPSDRHAPGGAVLEPRDGGGCRRSRESMDPTHDHGRMVW